MNSEKELPYIETKEAVPSEVVVMCPKVQFALRLGTVCNTCDRFEGVMVVSIEPNAPWEFSRRIVCAHPIARRAQTVKG